MAAKRVSKHINTSTNYNHIDDISTIDVTTDNLYDVLMSLKEKDITASFIMGIFGEFNGKAICHPYDTITVPKGVYHNNKNEFTTTVGIWIFNKLFIDEVDSIFNELGYVNENLGKKGFNDLNQKLSYAVMEDRVMPAELGRFMDKLMFCMQFETVLTPNYSEEMLTVSKKINKKKDELFKKYDKELKAGDIPTMELIEATLLNYAKELLGDDPSLDTFSSGCIGNFDNNFKNMFVSYGIVRDPDPNAKQEYNVVKSSFIDGVTAEEYAVVSNSLAGGPYSRGKKTSLGGYWEKLMISAYQDVIAGPKDSDCGTKNYVEVDLTKENINDWMYSYIISGSNLIELTSKNMDKYIGKRLKFRFASMCKNKDCRCNKCLGNYFYRVEKMNAGIYTAQVASSLKLKSMKAFHDSVVTTTEIDPMVAFGLK